MGAPASRVAGYRMADMSAAASEPPSADQSTTLISLIVLLVAIGMLWISAGDHALYPPDEGRYAAVSMHMADEGNWLTPHFQGEVHLNKPPLVYWMQAAGLKLIGHNELAVRLPSLIAASVMLALVLVAGRGWGGGRVGALAVGILSCMPLHVIVGRMAITDPVLAACWFAALLGGVRAVQTAQLRWSILLWIGVALGLMAKGPLALMPLVVIFLWLLLSKNLRALRRIHPLVGFPLAAAPVLIWAALVARANPEAMAIWRGQTFGRLVGEAGTNAHASPPWYYVPVFLAGLFPATLMLSLPWLNIRWRDGWSAIKRGDEGAFWIIAVLVPLVFFTAMSGKLATYLLPLAGPMALLGAMTLERWLRQEFDQPREGYKPPEIVVTLLVVNIILAALAIAGVMKWQPDLLPFAAPFVLLVAASAWLCLLWKRRPDLRWRGLMATWAAGVLAWCGFFEIEDAVRAPTDQRGLIAHLRDITHTDRPQIVIFGFRDPCIEFYARMPVVQADDCHDLTDVVAAHDPKSVVVLADDSDWAAMIANNRRCAEAFTVVEHTNRWGTTWVGWPDLLTFKTMDIMRPASATTGGQ